MNILYKNKRVVQVTGGPTSGEYTLTEVTYNEDGDVVNMEADCCLGMTLKEVKETLESLLADVENWVEEELTVKLV